MWTNATRDWTETSDFITLSAKTGLEYEFGAKIKGYVGVLYLSTLYQYYLTWIQMRIPPQITQGKIFVIDMYFYQTPWVLKFTFYIIVPSMIEILA